VRKALDNDLGIDSAEAVSLSAAIGTLPKVGILEQLTASTTTLRDELGELLGREDFYDSAADIRTRLSGLREQVKAAATGLGQEIANHLDSQRESITNLPEWAELPADDRSEFSSQLDGTTLSEATDIAGIRQLLNCRMELDSNLTQIRSAVLERYKKRNEEKKLSPAATPTSPATTPVKIRVRRNYTPTDQDALEQTIGALTNGLNSLKSATATEVSIDLD
jgi:hypothetical protein